MARRPWPSGSMVIERTSSACWMTPSVRLKPMTKSSISAGARHHHGEGHCAVDDVDRRLDRDMTRDRRSFSAVDVTDCRNDADRIDRLQS